MREFKEFRKYKTKKEAEQFIKDIKMFYAEEEIKNLTMKKEKGKWKIVFVSQFPDIK